MIAPLSQKLEPPANPVRFSFPGTVSDITGSKFDVARTEYDVGVDSSPIAIGNTTVALHGPALHNLVIRTETNFQGVKFSDLLKNDPTLRYALLENQAISGPVGNDREDPYGGEFGGSGVASSNDGPSTQILYRVLWKTVGQQNGLYDCFTYNFGERLSTGAVAQDEVWKPGSIAYGSLHAGFMFLGLQVVRDSIIRDGSGTVTPKGMEVFDLPSLIGGVGIDTRQIHDASGDTFGKSELSYAFQKILVENGFSTGLIISVDWTVAVAQNGSGSLSYDGSSSAIELGHIVFGGEQSDTITTSTGKDFISAGNGNDLINAGGGADIIVGGGNSGDGDTVSYVGSTDRIAVRLDIPFRSQVGGNAEGDILIGIENVIGSSHEDIIFGDAGKNILSGGAGRDIIKGEGGDDIVYIGRDGDILHGGADNDTFLIDGTIGYTVTSLGATVYGGEGLDVIEVSSDQLTARDKSDIWKGLIAGVSYYEIESIKIDGSLFDASSITNEYFTGSNSALNALIGEQKNSQWNSVDTATYVVGGSTQTARLFHGSLPATQHVPENAVVTSATGSFSLDYNTTYNLNVTLTLHSGLWWLEALLPASTEIDLDMLSLTHESGRAYYDFTYDYEVWVPDQVGEGYHSEIWTGSESAWSDIGLINGYDKPMSELFAPDVVHADRGLRVQSLANGELRFTHNGLETSRPILYSILEDTSGRLVIDPLTGVLSGRDGNIFPNGETIHAIIQVTDGVTTLTKDVEIIMDTSIEVAPVIHGNNTAHETLPFEGQPIGQWLVWDPNYPTGDRTPSVDEISVTFETVGSSNPEPLLRAEGLWRIVLARNPETSEIGVPLQVKMIVTDDTGQTTESILSFTIDPVESIINGTNAADNLQADPQSARMFTINGLGGNDILSSNNKDNTILNGGDGSDSLSLNSDLSFANGENGDDTIYFSGNGHVINGGNGDDTIDTFGFATSTMITGGAGSDVIRVINTNATIVYNTIFDSYLNDADEESDGPSGEWDTLVLFGDDDVIDLSALGEIEWGDDATSSNSALAYILEGDQDGGFFVIDTDRDGDFDFGIEFQLLQAQEAIHFIGLSDFQLAA